MTTDTILTIALVEDHLLMREGLRVLLDAVDGMEVVGEASTLAEAAALEGDPDVVVTDLMLPDGRGPDVVRMVAERFPRSAILVLSMVDNATDVQLAFSAGARGYLLKEAASSELVEAVRRVGAGEDYLHPRLGATLASKRPVGRVHVSATVDLSEREIEVLRLIGTGHTNAEIATLLHLSLRTIENHRASVQRKLGVRTRAELVREASERGLLAQD